MTDMIRTISPSDMVESRAHRDLYETLFVRAVRRGAIEGNAEVGFIERVGRTWELTVYTARHPETTTKVVRVPVIGNE